MDETRRALDAPYVEGPGSLNHTTSITQGHGTDSSRHVLSSSPLTTLDGHLIGGARRGRRGA